MIDDCKGGYTPWGHVQFTSVSPVTTLIQCSRLYPVHSVLSEWYSKQYVGILVTYTSVRLALKRLAVDIVCPLTKRPDYLSTLRVLALHLLPCCEVW